MNKLFLSLDLGTQGIRTGVIDEKGNLVTSCEHSYNTVFYNQGWAEQDSNKWYRYCLETIENVLAKLSWSERKNIAGMCACATSSTVVCINENGDGIAPAILWMDTRSSAEVQAINNSGSSALSCCGGDVSTEWLLPKVAWLKKNKPEIYRKSFRIVDQLDWLNYKLTRKLRTSFCNATCKYNYIADINDWDRTILRSVDLEDYKEKIITDTARVGELIGYLTPELCDKLRLPKGIPVYEGCIDAYAAIPGLGVHTEGKMAAILGTSFVELCLSKDPESFSGIWGPYKDVMYEGYSVIEGGQISAGSISKWYRSILNISDSKGFQKLTAEAKESGIGANGTTALDFFQGNRTPYKNPFMKGSLHLMTLSTSRGDIYRAILESVAYGFRNILDTITKGNTTINSITACGGVIKDPLWLSIISDICGIPISITESSTYAGIMGCSVISSVSSGIYSDFQQATSQMIREKLLVTPNLVNSKQYEELYENYLENCLREIELTYS